MSETGALLAVYSAIDDAVADDPAIAGRLGALFGAYADGGAIGWSGRFSDWRIERASLLPAPPSMPPPAGALATTGDALDEVTIALTRLAETTPTPRQASRRMLALAAAMRAFPELRPGGSQSAVARSLLLSERHLAPTDDLSARLHERLTEDHFSAMSDWSVVLQGAIDDGLVASGLRYQTDAPPCIGRLVMMEDPNDHEADPVAVLTTCFRTDAVTFEACVDHLAPDNWPTGSDFWCSMAPIGNTAGQNPTIYHEVVSVDCADPAAWTMTTPLSVWFSHPEQDWAYLEYDLPPGSPTPTADIEVDQGYISVRRDGAGIVVETSKRVRFAGSLDGACMAMISCVTGYGAAAEDMVFNLADSTEPPAHPFPVTFQPPPRRRRRGQPPLIIGPATPDPTPSTPTPPTPPSPVSKVGEALQGWAELGQWWVSSWSTALGQVAAHATSGSYDADTAMDDTAAGIQLAATTLQRILGESADSLAIMSSHIDQPDMVTTAKFTIHESLAVNGDRTLTVAGPFTSIAGGELPPGCLTPVPALLTAAAPSFVFEVDGTGHSSRVYRGTVNATDPTGQVEALPAFVLLP